MAKITVKYLQFCNLWYILPIFVTLCILHIFLIVHFNSSVKQSFEETKNVLAIKTISSIIADKRIEPHNYENQIEQDQVTNDHQIKVKIPEKSNKSENKEPIKTTTTKLVTMNLNKLRKFIKTKEELELTKVVNIMPEKCRDTQKISVYITSRVSGYKRRELLRNTWVYEFRRHNISVFFAIGLTHNQTEQQVIENEVQKYGDLIQFGFIDAYHNLTLKTIAILRWTENYCKTKHVFKVDDDVLVNVDIVLNSLDQLKKGIYGLLYYKVNPIGRRPQSKWFMPRELYKTNYYPAYVIGSGYLLSGYSAQSLLRGIDSYQDSVLYLEDIFITGIIAEKVKLKRYWSKMFVKHMYPCSDYCVLSKNGVYFDCSKDSMIENMWKKWNKNKKVCSVKKMG